MKKNQKNHQLWHSYCSIFFMKIISVILLFLYCVPSFLGIGVFHCGCTQSQGLVVMSVHQEATCPPCSSSDDSCCPHGEQQHGKNDVQDDECSDDECCSLEYQSLDADYLNATRLNDTQSKSVSLLLFSFSMIDSGVTNIKKNVTAAQNHSLPPGSLLNVPLIYMILQLRL